MKRLFFRVAMVVVAGLAGMVLHLWQRGSLSLPTMHDADTTSGNRQAPALADVTQNVMQGIPRPEFKLQDASGVVHSVSEWDGKVLIVNFWATWCAPCRQEIPAFVQLQERFQAAGLQFVGIAIDDKDSVQAFLKQTPVNYPILISEEEGIRVAQAYGDSIGALPFTAVVGKRGHILLAKPGEFARGELEQTVLKLLKS